MPRKKKRSSTVSAKTHRKRRARSRKAGLCGQCHRTNSREGYRICEDCTFKNLSLKHLGTKTKWLVLKELLMAQEYKCAYTGWPIDIGDGASVEHIKPRSTHPREQHDIENLKWVHREVNTAKHKMSLSDFINLCKCVVFYAGYRILKDD